MIKYIFIIAALFSANPVSAKTCDPYNFKEKVQMGMSERGVWEVTGCNGKIVSETKLGNMYSVGMKYPGNNYLIFQNFKVVGKM